MIYFIYLIPVILAGIFHTLYSKRIVYWESILVFLGPTLIIGLAHLIIIFCAKADQTKIEKLVNHVVYTEAYETYVDETCQSCTTDSKGNESCHTYDCSYCDDFPENYKAYALDGNSWLIGRYEYDSISREFLPNKPIFIDLQRKIKKGFRCGFDGDAYKVFWNGEIKHSITKQTKVVFDNPILINRNAYNMKSYTDDEVKSIGLYVYDNQTNVYGLNQSGLDTNSQNDFKRLLNYYNTVIGNHNQSTMTFVFTNKNIDFAKQQSKLWVGGKNNQMVIVIGLESNSTRIKYVHPFSWNKSQRIHIDLRNDIFKFRDIRNYESIIKTTSKLMTKKFKTRNMDEFSYLSIELSTIQLVLLIMISILSSIGIGLYCIHNDFNYGEN